MNTNNSPTPWMSTPIENVGEQYDFTALYDASGNWIGSIAEKEAARIILQAVNSNAELMKALQDVTSGYENFINDLMNNPEDTVEFAKAWKVTPKNMACIINAKTALAHARGEK